MTDAAALRRAILCNPGDDTVRMIYADAIEETQPERAEFIRVQVRIAVLLRGWAVSSEGAPPELDALRARARELLRGPHSFDPKAPLEDHSDADGGFLVSKQISDNHAVRWFLGNFLLTMNLKPVYTRGFVSSLTCTAADWLAHADAIRAAQPITHVTLTTRPTCGMAGFHNEPGVMERWFPGRYSGIEFEIPPVREFDLRVEIEEDGRIVPVWPDSEQLIPDGYRVEWLPGATATSPRLIIPHQHGTIRSMFNTSIEDLEAIQFERIECRSVRWRARYRFYAGYCRQCRIVFITEPVDMIVHGDPDAPRPQGLIPASS